MARVAEVKVIYERIFLIFEAAHDYFRVAFHSFAKDVFLELIEEGDDTNDETV